LLDVDANPEQQKQNSKAHEDGGNERHQQLLEDIARELG